MTICIGILLYPNAQMSAVLGLTDLFQLADEIAGETSAVPRMCVQHLTLEDGTPHLVFASDPAPNSRPDVLILPPSLAQPITAAAAAPLTNWLRACHAEGTVLASVCAGAFLLGETGLLAGRAVTTHWTHAQTMQDRFPDAKVDADRLIIDGGDILSAGGLMAWTDLGLKLVDRFLGPITMAATARMMLVDPPGREQRYYSGFVPRLTHGDAAILKSQHALQASEGRDAALGLLAEIAGLEQRTFLRRFQKATGLTATDYAQRLRVAKAQELLRFGQKPIEGVAWEVGYSDPGAFRKVFLRIVGLTPGDYRQRFRS
ncbi:AraC family transcriptional regulator [Cypionkella aquatica]|uniref:AraC family transcriptional regulator n=1 Tax=Cypionkella aquatica TaxID=1756042 RepID=A0AA37U1E0_9RHOB|nr:helix-turn-helix domain-containing protein [Cypionkella aquatica]GLS88928.1 AraC family transcriptional regulator [Cypionkella aquatica]